MDITREQLKSFFEDTSDEVIASFVDPLNKAMDKFDINNTNRIAMFLAQVGHESGGLTKTQENLNYKPERLAQIFPKYFRDVNPEDYAHNPEKIANRVYADRMGNGDEDSGDGYRFRGRGLVQLTGRDNYTKFADAIGMDADSVVDFMATPDGAAMSAAWFWDQHNLNKWADEQDVDTVTKKINGGTIGLEERKQLFEEALTIFV